jgi:hypothetical protein
MFVFALTVQDALHESALGSGVVITPMAVAFFVGSLYAPTWFTRFGRWTIVLGMLLQMAGLIGLVAVATASWPHVSGWALAGPLVVAGFGQALGLVGLFRTVLGDVPPRLAGVGSGVLVTVQQASLAMGVAILGAVYFSIDVTSARNAFAVVVGIQAGIALLVAIGAAVGRRRSPTGLVPAAG